MIYDRIPMRLAGGKRIIIELLFPMTDEQWEHMLEYLQVMKEGYVRNRDLCESKIPDGLPAFGD